MGKVYEGELPVELAERATGILDSLYGNLYSEEGRKLCDIVYLLRQFGVQDAAILDEVRLWLENEILFRFV
jgi:hypothetical protein